jgi:indolepyruvate ferredoxin oxidoreductase
VDRSGDVLKHANAAGTSKHGGVLCFAGDDHAAKSSTVPHQTDHDFMSAVIPVLYPSSIHEFMEYGLLGIAMSRYSGCWVGMKFIADTVETTAAVDLSGEKRQFVMPTDFELPPGGLNIRWPDPPLIQDDRLQTYKAYAAIAFARANRVDEITHDAPHARFGIISSGKAYEDVLQALRELELGRAEMEAIGIRILKIRMPWPLEPEADRHFSEGLDEVLVIEERREIIENQIKQQLFNWRSDVRPRIVGKFDEHDKPYLSLSAALTVGAVARAIAGRILKLDMDPALHQRISDKLAYLSERGQISRSHVPPLQRTPFFCSGCPHNTSTRVPDGSRATAGIGCHYMVTWMDRNTETFTQMGGEGVPWTAISRYTDEKHMFVNLGDGTYFHSGILAVRQSVAAKVNVTYKLLYNDAVAMTGGQQIDGYMTPQLMTKQLYNEGVSPIYLLSDNPDAYVAPELAPGVTVLHRDHLDPVMLKLRETPGCSAIVYVQTCAAEKRRRRSRGLMEDPAKRVFINEAVCEGCGDCSVQSNCLSVEPLDTPLGTKRRINQSSCNKDFSCVEGFCPSFVTAEGATPRKPGKQGGVPSLAEVPLPGQAVIAPGAAYRVVVAGVGGTGVVTVGALIGAAAHIEGKGVTVLDMAGLAQKGGAVLSHVQLANRPEDLHATRVALGEADLVIGCDALVSASPEVLSRLRPDHGRAVVNSSAAPTAAFLSQPTWRFPGAQAQAALTQSTGGNCDFLEAGPLAEALLGDSIYANPLLLGYAWQKGGLPLSLDSLRRAIQINGVSVDKNLAAFELGRQAAHRGVDALRPAAAERVVTMPESLDALVKRLAAHVRDYQDEAYARRFLTAVESVRVREAALGDKRQDVTRAVARNLAKLMTYKDEYEVARLHADPAFKDRLRAQFEGEPGRDYTLRYYLAPPILARRDARGRLQKRAYGAWMESAFRLLAPLKRVRGTWLDVFGRTAERRMERQLAADYLALADEFARTLDAGNRDVALELANVPDAIRGYGHVKEKSVEQARVRQAGLWERYRSGGADRLAA